MPRAKFHDGSGWTDLPISGAVDFGGDRLPFGPPGGGTIDEFLPFPTPLSHLNWPDAGANVGTRFAVEEAGSWIGVRLWRTEFVQNPGDEYVFAGNSNTNALLSPNTPLVGETRAAFVIQEFAAPIAVVPGVDYIACYHTNRYGFSRVIDGAVPPFASDRIFTDSTMGAVAFFTYANNTVPSSASPNFHFNVSPVVRFPA